MSDTSFVPPALLELMKLWPLFMLLAALIFGGILLYLGSKFVTHKRCTEHRGQAQETQSEVQLSLAGVKKELQALERDKGKLIGAVEADVAALKHRLDSVEGAVKALPTERSIYELIVEIEKARGEMRGVTAQMHGTRDLMRSTEQQILLLIRNELMEARRE